MDIQTIMHTEKGEAATFQFHGKKLQKAKNVGAEARMMQISNCSILRKVFREYFEA